MWNLRATVVGGVSLPMRETEFPRAWTVSLLGALVPGLRPAESHPRGTQLSAPAPSEVGHNGGGEELHLQPPSLEPPLLEDLEPHQ